MPTRLETWIRPNRRALAFGLLLPVVLLAVATGAILLGVWQQTWLWLAAGTVLGLVALVASGTLWRLIRQPRVGYQSGDVLIYAGLTEPLRVPVEAVECFFLGQAGGMIPDASGREAEVRTVIVRLAESATDWHHREVKAQFAHWCEGYITIRGTWCEPITPELMKRLNQRLAGLHRDRKVQAEATS